MDRRTLGATGRAVSAIGFGGAAIGIQGYIDGRDRDDAAFREQARAALLAAVAGGIDYFDTAPVYGDGRSETIFGQVLEPLRSQIFLATKFKWTPGVTERQLDEALGQSLERLKTRQVDLLQYHGINVGDDEADRLLGSCVPQWLARVKAVGRARHAGFTAELPTPAVERLLRSGHFEVMQIGYNVMATTACDYRWAPFGVIPLARQLGIGVVTMRTSTSGLLQRLMASEFHGLDLRELTRMAIRFVLSTAEVDCALVGMQSMDDVNDSLVLIGDGARRYDLPQLNRRR